MKDNIREITIVGNGDDCPKSKLISYSERSDLIIASDGGLNLLSEYKIKPDLIMGDFDSISKGIIDAYEDVEICKFPTEKDFTDSELALQKALSYDPEEINLLGMTGSYFDHSIANVLNLLKYGDNGVHISIINGNSTIFLIKGSSIFEGLEYRRISFFPLGDVKGLRLKGFKYVYNKTDINMTDYSISNVISSNFAEIEFNEGHMICVMFDEGYK
jgi:thiamine pyrophosphokinase